MIREFLYNIRKGNRIGAICVFSYRIAHILVEHGYLVKIIGCLWLVYYHIIIRNIIGFDIHEKAKIGQNFTVYHCFGIAINPEVQIGNNVTMAHNTTIGHNHGFSPIIENGVQISPMVSIVGNVRIGENSIIGIGSVVVNDIPSNCIVAGNPARKIKDM